MPNGPRPRPIPWPAQSPAHAPSAATTVSPANAGTSDVPSRTAIVITVDSLGMNGSSASSPATANTTSHSHGSSRWLCSSVVMSCRRSNMRGPVVGVRGGRGAGRGVSLDGVLRAVGEGAAVAGRAEGVVDVDVDLELAGPDDADQ